MAIAESAAPGDAAGPGAAAGRRRAALGLLPVLAVGWGAPPLPPHAGESDAVAVVAAYVGAWNAHDLDAALAFFAPDAVIRHRGPGVPDAVWAAAHLGPVAEDEGRGDDPASIALLDGTEAIRRHLRAEFGWGIHVETADYRATAHGATWTYRQHQDPDRRLPGVEPIEGRAEARLRAGRITHLSLAPDPAAGVRRDAAVAVVLARRRATHPNPPAGAGEVTGPSRGRSGAGSAGMREPESPRPLLALLLGGLVAGAAVRVRRRPVRQVGAPAGKLPPAQASRRDARAL